MRVTFYTEKCPNPLIYARFRVFCVQSALRGGRLLVEKPEFFDDLSHAQPVHDFFLSRVGKNCPHPVDKPGQKKRKLEKMTIFCCVTGNYHNITKQNA
ncbi:MAG TPA: hypothetical protein K8V27_06345 [Butyricicoccus pullicaecorum]|nr:hypothetical protein [Butyricicoccus pullicaecorum]